MLSRSATPRCNRLRADATSDVSQVYSADGVGYESMMLLFFTAVVGIRGGSIPPDNGAEKARTASIARIIRARIIRARTHLLRTHASINAHTHACERVRVHSPACVCVCQHPLPQCMRACVFIRASGCAAAVTRMG